MIDVEEFTTKQLKVTATLKSGNIQVVTGQCEYLSDDETFVTVSNSGLLTGVTPGPANIRVTINGIVSIVAVTCTPGM